MDFKTLSIRNQSGWWWFIRITGKQSVKKGVWYITVKRKYRRRKQRGKGLLIGLLASAAVPILGEVAKAILKKNVNGRKRRWEKK